MPRRAANRSLPVQQDEQSVVDGFLAITPMHELDVDYLYGAIATESLEKVCASFWRFAHHIPKLRQQDLSAEKSLLVSWEAGWSFHLRPKSSLSAQVCDSPCLLSIPLSAEMSDELQLASFKKAFCDSLHLRHRLYVAVGNEVPLTFAFLHVVS